MSFLNSEIETSNNITPFTGTGPRTQNTQRCSAYTPTEDPALPVVNLPMSGLPPTPRQILDKWHAEISRALNDNAVRTFSTSPTDLVIVTYPKSGTTLLQQLTYQLLAAAGRVPTDADGELFEDISEVVPFIEQHVACGINQPVHEMKPRLWHSHADVDRFDLTRGRYIYCIRDGLQCAGSFLDFTAEWITGMRVDDEVKRQLYSMWFMEYFLGLQRIENGYERKERCVGGWFKHVKAWLEKANDNVLVLVYEDVVADMRWTIRRVAQFMDVPCSEETVRLVEKKCDRDVMAADKRFKAMKMSKAMGWDEEGGVRVRPQGAIGFKQVELAGECLDNYYGMMRESFGVEAYQEVVQRARERDGN